MIAKVSVTIDVPVVGHGFDARFCRDCGNGRVSVCHGGLRKPDLCLGQGELSPAFAPARLRDLPWCAPASGRARTRPESRRCRRSSTRPGRWCRFPSPDRSARTARRKPCQAPVIRPHSEETSRAAEAAGFRSREPKGTENQTGCTPQLRRLRTGRNAKFNLKARPETIAAYCALADRMGRGLGETLEKAVDLLEERYSE